MVLPINSITRSIYFYYFKTMNNRQKKTHYIKANILPLQHGKYLSSLIKIITLAMINVFLL